MARSRAAGTVPGPSVGALVRLVPSLLRRDPVEIAVDLRERYGYVVRIPPVYPGIERPAYLVTHPEDVRYVLQSHATAFGGLDIPGSDDFAAAVEGSILGTSAGGSDWWQRRLRRLKPEFEADAVSPNATELAATTAATAAEFAGGAADVGVTGAGAAETTVVVAGDGEIRVQPFAARLSLRLLGTTLFGPDARFHEEAVIRAVGELRRAFKRRTFGILADGVTRHLPDVADDLVDRVQSRYEPDWVDPAGDPLEDLRAEAAAIVDRRERAPGGYDDAITRWWRRPDPITGETLDREAVEAEVTGMLIAGFATVSAALTWAIALLATNPDVQRRVAAEATSSTILSNAPGADPEYETLRADLGLAHRVWRETLRLYPTLPVFGRTTAKPVRIRGYPIGADAPVLVSPYVTGRDPAIWNDPERFDPERFESARTADRHEFATYPFSAGPHACLGRSVATVEGTVALAALCRAYRIGLVEGTAPTGVDSAINLVPENDVRVRLVPRDT